MLADITKRPRTKRVFADADMARLRDLYYDRTVPLTRVAQGFDIPVSTLLRWIAELDWPRRSTQPDWRGEETNAPLIEPDALSASADAMPHDPQNTERLATKVADAARFDLAALGPLDGPAEASLTLFERERRAKIFASLSQSIARIERVNAARTERRALMARIGELEREIDARMEGPFAAMQALIEQQLVAQATERLPPRPTPDLRRKRT